jgi:hypothetical protein
MIERERDATCNSYPGAIRFRDKGIGVFTLGGSANFWFCRCCACTAVAEFKDSTAVSLWDADAAAVKRIKWQGLARQTLHFGVMNQAIIL